MAHVERHGVSRAEIDSMVALDFWEDFPDPPGGPHRRLMIGYTERGRIVTLVAQLDPADAARRVPVTCWPSTPREIAAFHRRFWRHRRP